MSLKGLRPINPGQSRRLQNRVLMVGALILVAGGIAAIITFVGSENPKPLKSTLRDERPTDVSKIPKTVKLDQQAARVIQKFLATNVVRENLADGYDLVGPELKEGLSLKEWLTGNIPVVPYDGDVIDKVPIQVIYSHPREALLRVFMLPKKGTKISGGAFYLTVKLYGSGAKAHWLVDGWVPYGTTKVPSAGRNT